MNSIPFDKQTSQSFADQTKDPAHSSKGIYSFTSTVKIVQLKELSNKKTSVWGIEKVGVDQGESQIRKLKAMCQ